MGFEPSWIGVAARQVGVALNAERVLVFGSYAQGTASRHSDLDLFVVAQTDLSPLQRIEAALRALPRLSCDVDVIVYTPSEIAHVQSKFVEGILRTGIIVYEHQ